MLSHVRRLFWSSPTFQSAIFFPNLDMLSRRKLWWTRPYTLLHALLCADFFQWRKRLLLKLRAADRNFADLKAHANLCTSAIWPVMQEYKSVRWRVKNWLAGNPPQPHDDAISSHVYETKGFLSESTTSATPTHTVTLGVIYSKTSRCMQMRSTRRPDHYHQHSKQLIRIA